MLEAEILVAKNAKEETAQQEDFEAAAIWLTKQQTRETRKQKIASMVKNQDWEFRTWTSTQPSTTERTFHSKQPPTTSLERTLNQKHRHHMYSANVPRCSVQNMENAVKQSAHNQIPNLPQPRPSPSPPSKAPESERAHDARDQRLPKTTCADYAHQRTYSRGSAESARKLNN